jgi:hypothetical protein
MAVEARLSPKNPARVLCGALGCGREIATVETLAHGRVLIFPPGWVPRSSDGTWQLSRHASANARYAAHNPGMTVTVGTRRKPPSVHMQQDDGSLITTPTKPTPVAYPARAVCPSCGMVQELDAHRLGGLVLWTPTQAPPSRPAVMTRAIVTRETPDLGAAVATMRPPVPEEPWDSKQALQVIRRTLKQMRRDAVARGEPTAVPEWKAVVTGAHALLRQCTYPVPPEALEGAAIFVTQGFSVEDVVGMVAPVLEHQGQRLTATVRRRILTGFLRSLAASAQGEPDAMSSWLASAVAPATICASE